MGERIPTPDNVAPSPQKTNKQKAKTKTKQKKPRRNGRSNVDVKKTQNEDIPCIGQLMPLKTVMQYTYMSTIFALRLTNSLTYIARPSKVELLS